MAETLLCHSTVRDFAFADPAPVVLPRHNTSTLVVAAMLHVLLFVVLTQVKARPVRVRTAGSPSQGIAAYIAGPASVMPATVAAPKPAEPKKTALKTETAKASQKDEVADAHAVGSAGAVGAAQPDQGPVRLGGSGGNVTLIKKVQPLYPGVLQAARVTGRVVLDAIINPDGTIGDVTVLSSTNDAFSQSAIAAVKQWRYTAIGFRGVLTVTVNFTLT
jgi:TonB family protein